MSKEKTGIQGTELTWTSSGANVVVGFSFDWLRLWEFLWSNLEWLWSKTSTISIYFFNDQFNGALLTVCTKIRGYIMVTFSMNVSQFSISRSFFLSSVVLLVFLMDWGEMVYFYVLLLLSYGKKIYFYQFTPFRATCSGTFAEWNTWWR